jgi:hypothetical protein
VDTATVEKIKVPGLNCDGVPFDLVFCGVLVEGAIRDMLPYLRCP